MKPQVFILFSIIKAPSTRITAMAKEHTSGQMGLNS